MKKNSLKKKLKIFFWLFFVLGSLWVYFAPRPPHAPRVAHNITVEVEQPPAPPPEQQTPPEESASPATTPPPASGEEPATQLPEAESIKVPITPENQEPMAGNDHPRIAIVIDDVGVDLKGSARAIDLPAPVTLSFLPYAVRLREQTKEARDKGHELLLHMPMEPIGHEDPGPGALLVNLPPEEQQKRFEAALGSFAGFDGVNNHMGSKYTAYAPGMDMVMDELKLHHLFFFDSRTSPQSIGKKTAVEKGLPTVSRDVFLDDVQTPDAIRAQLAETERIARHKGYAVAIGHPHAATMDVLPEWMTEAEKQGFVFVPLKTLVKSSSAR